MSTRIIVNESFLPHQSIVLAKEKNIPDFKIEKIIPAFEMRKNEQLECPIWELEVHPVDYCGLGCYGCSYAERHSGNVINLKELVNGIKYYERFDLKTVFFSGGGDPCNWKEWNQFVNLMGCRKWKLGISTNLFSLSNIMNILHEFDFYQIHVVGYNAKSVFRETGVEAFDRIHNNLETLFLQKKSKQSITLKVLLTNQNYKYIEQFLDYIEMFECDAVVIKMEQNFMGNSQVNGEIQLQEVRGTLYEHSILGKFSYVLDNLEDKVFENPVPRHCYVANAGLYSLIRADGNIYPCVAGTYDKQNAYAHISKIDEYNNKKVSEAYYDNLMLGKVCPLGACRHYRFNSIIERHEQGEVLEVINKSPVLL